MMFAFIVMIIITEIVCQLIAGCLSHYIPKQGKAASLQCAVTWITAVTLAVVLSACEGLASGKSAFQNVYHLSFRTKYTFRMRKPRL